MKEFEWEGYEETEVDPFGLIATTMVLAFGSPLLAYGVEQILPAAFFVEELIKAILVWRLYPLQDRYLSLALTVGIVFGLSESMLYIVNASWLGNLGPLGWRLALTVPMHGLAAFIFAYYSRSGRYWLLVGISMAMALHGIFNAIVG